MAVRTKKAALQARENRTGNAMVRDAADNPRERPGLATTQAPRPLNQVWTAADRVWRHLRNRSDVSREEWSTFDRPDRDVSLPRVTARYESPRIERLGTLAELTKGGTTGPDDGFGGAGDNGSL